VRPEKMQIVRAEPAVAQEATDNRVAATVVDVGYLGDLTIYKLRSDAGVQIKAAVANTGRSGDDVIGWDDKVWLRVPPQAAIVLTR